MNKENFAELVESIKQAGAIKRGERAASRRFEVKPQNVRRIRRRFDASQNRFAQMLGVSVNTLQNWEQGRCRPTGPARVWLFIADRNPVLLRETIDFEATQSKQQQTKKEFAFA